MSQPRFLAAVAVGMFVAQSASLMLAPLLVAMEAVAGPLATATFAAGPSPVPRGSVNQVDEAVY